MAATALTLEAAHGWLLLVLVAAILEHYLWMGTVVNKARKRLNVPYPHCYAPPGHPHETAFNCIQRGHQNSLESLPGVLASLLVAGVGFLLLSSIAGALYLAGRYSYFTGYCSGDPEARLRGLMPLQIVGEFSLLGLVAWWGAQLLLGAA